MAAGNTHAGTCSSSGAAAAGRNVIITSRNIFAVMQVAVILLVALSSASVSSGRRHLWSRTANLTVFMHGAINFTDFVAVPGVAGLGSSEVTAEAGPFGSVFVFNDPLTATPDPSSASLGSFKGFGVTTSFDGTVFHITATANLSSPAPFTGTFNIVGLSGGPIPISGGTGDFLFVQGYTLSSRYSVVALNTTYQIDISFFWP